MSTDTTQSTNTLLQVRNLKKHFPVRSGVFSRVEGWVKAVDDVSFEIYEGETLGLVGESGCGKTTVGRTLLRLMEPTSGTVMFDGKDITAMNPTQLRRMRPDMQIIFQDPYSSLNPRMTIGSIIGEAMNAHGRTNRQAQAQKVAVLLEYVGLSPTYHSRYPHEFSGGQRQRIGIARALAMEPKFIVCDEPVSALDVSIQAQILNLLQDLKDEHNLSYLFISHDLHVVQHVANRVAVMYLGNLAEVAPVDELFRTPKHPYTQALISANPIPDPTVKTEQILLPGDVPSPLNPPTGCRFHTRCSHVMDHCKTTEPPLIHIGDGKTKHQVWCHLYDQK